MTFQISHSHAQFIHSRKRADERYGLKYDKKLSKELVKQIQIQKDVHFIYRESKRVTIWLVKHQDSWYPVCYDSQTHNIVTFLPTTFVRSQEVWDFAKRAKKFVFLYQGKIQVR